jgi:hypothetical protein
MNRFIIFVILFSIGSILSAQNPKPKKSDLKKLIRKSINQDSRKTITTISNPWVTDNQDSLYYKADTLRLINIKKRPYKYNFCEKVNWTFYRNNQMFLIESQTCREPTTANVSNEKSKIRIEIKKTDLGLILATFDLNGIVSEYLVLSISRNEMEDEIVLKRLSEKASG